MPTLEDLDLAHQLYLENEPRDLNYRVAVFMVEHARGRDPAFTLAEALALLLDSWNFAFYRRRPAARQTLVADLGTLLGEHEGTLRD